MRRRTWGGGRRLFPGRLLAGQGRLALQQARRLQANGDHREAAVLFENLAQAADQHGLLGRAPLLYFKAGRAWLRSGDPQAALPMYLDALQGFQSSGQTIAMQRAAQAALADLQAANAGAEATELQTWLDSQAPGTVPPAAPPPRLPTHCPQCGASLRPGEVDWLDDRTAECPYCGSAVAAA